MKHLNIVIVGIAVLATACSTGSVDYAGSRLTAFVDPFTGTGSNGHVFLGANVPFGMVQAGPSQSVKGWDWCSGYHYSDTTLLGFSQTHLSGTGVGDLGDILLLPALNATDSIATFSHDSEVCCPGYYTVTLDNGIIADMTATTRAALYRFSYPQSADSVYVKIDLGYGTGWDRPTYTEVSIDNDSTVTGYRRSSGWARDQHIYFDAVFSRPVAAFSVDSAGNARIATLAFANSATPLEVKVGLSAVSTANAAENLAYETDGKDFNTVAREADDAWNAALSRITVKSDNLDDLVNFYTSMYHAFTAPVTFSDVNGDYRGADGEIHNTGGKFTNYTVLSLWDTYRAAHPLYTIVCPEMQNDIAETFINIYRQQGKLPVWHLHGNETDCMVGNPGVIVLGDLFLKGFVEDSVAAFDAMKGSTMLDERSLGEWKKYGYIPYDSDDSNENVAKGLEYAIADNAVARVAAAMGREEDAAVYERRASGYAHYFDSVTRFMRGKSATGEFRTGPFDPYATNHRADDYCEGNAWQYTWLVPHDPHGLIKLFGSDEQFVNKLDSLFIVDSTLSDDASPDISGLIGQYAHGNEPSHHILYLYNYAGMPWKAAPLLRRVMDELYTPGPLGLCGNEDVGQMSAWYILSSIGLYQVEPSGGRFIIGSPLFDKATVNVGNGQTFSIIARNNSADNIYVQSVRLNGHNYDKSYIDYADIAAGGTLVLEMGPEPSTTFGTTPASRP